MGCGTARATRIRRWSTATIASRVPADAPAYTLRRIWLSEEEERRYYNGFANEGLWPLAHTVHVRPRFRSEDWAAYQRVNARFAAAVADELTEPDESGVHPGLPSGAGRRRTAARCEPRVRTAFFWHIPWPHPDRLRICPWRREILRGCWRTT